jgi:hypothetical protein
MRGYFRIDTYYYPSYISLWIVIVKILKIQFHPETFHVHN